MYSTFGSGRREEKFLHEWVGKLLENALTDDRRKEAGAALSPFLTATTSVKDLGSLQKVVTVLLVLFSVGLSMPGSLEIVSKKPLPYAKLVLRA